MSRKLLLVAYYFPPVVSSGSFRPAKFAKYLPEHGWDPYVVSGCGDPFSREDKSLLKDSRRDLKLWRVAIPAPKPLDQLRRWFGADGSSENPSNGSSDGKSYSLLERVLLAPFSVIQDPPIDQQIYWALRVVPLCLRIIRREKIDAILTTSAPWSTLVTGLLLQKLSGLPWTADMRDPWTSDEVRYKVQGWRRRVDTAVEALCLSQADRVIGVNEKWVAELRALVGDHDRAPKVYLITNGYDAADFAKSGQTCAEGGADRRTIQIVHFGSMYQGALRPLLSALELLDGSVASKLRFQLTGYVAPDDLRSLERSTARSLISYQPERVSHEEALMRMCAADVLLLPLSFEYYPGKLFEYMRVGRPVLAVTPPGTAAELVKKSGIGCVVWRNDIETLANILNEIVLDYPGFVSKYYQPNEPLIKTFDRRRLTGRLAEVLESAKQI